MSASSTDRTAEFLALANAAARQRRVWPSFGWKPRTRDLEQPNRLAAYNDVHNLLHTKRAPLVPPAQIFNVALRATKIAQAEALRARNDQQHLHFTIVEQLLQLRATEFEARSKTVVRRAQAMTAVERQLLNVDQLLAVVCRMVEQQSHSIDVVERNVERIRVRIDASEAELADLAPRVYKTRRARLIDAVPCIPRTLSGRLRGALALLIAFNLVLFYYGLL